MLHSLTKHKVTLKSRRVASESNRASTDRYAAVWCVKIDPRLSKSVSERLLCIRARDPAALPLARCTSGQRQARPGDGCPARVLIVSLLLVGMPGAP